MSATKYAFMILFAVILLFVFTVYLYNTNEGVRDAANGSLSILENLNGFQLEPKDTGDQNLVRNAFPGEIQNEQGDVTSLFCDSTHCYVGREEGAIEKISKANGRSAWKRQYGTNSFPYQGYTNAYPYSIACDSEFCYEGYYLVTQLIGKKLYSKAIAKVAKDNGEVIWGDNDPKIFESVSETSAPSFAFNVLECKLEYCYVASGGYADNNGYIIRFDRQTGNQHVESNLYANNGNRRSTGSVNGVYCDNSTDPNTAPANSCYILWHYKYDVDGSATKSLDAYITKINTDRLGSSDNSNYQFSYRICEMSSFLSQWCPNNSSSNNGILGIATKEIICNGDDMFHGDCYALLIAVKCGFAYIGECTPTGAGPDIYELHPYIVKFNKFTMKAEWVRPIGSNELNGISRNADCRDVQKVPECVLLNNDYIYRFNETNLDKYPPMTYTDLKQPTLIQCDDNYCYATGTDPTKGGSNEPYFRAVPRGKII